MSQQGTVREITTIDELVGILGEPHERTVNKGRPALIQDDLDWLAASPFCVLATADADGTCDASPKGDPAGTLVHIIDERTIAIAERPGNRRADGYRNVLTNPHVGVISIIPGRPETLRINGRARLLADAPYFDALAVRGRRPVMVLEIAIEDIFFHCAKAFLRSGLWEPSSWTAVAGADGQDAAAAEASFAARDRQSVELYGQGLY